MNIGEEERREIFIEPIEEPGWIEPATTPVHVPEAEPAKAPVPA